MVQALIHLVWEPEFWALVVLTRFGFLGGFALGAATGFVLAVLTEFIPFCSVVLAPAVALYGQHRWRPLSFYVCCG